MPVVGIASASQGPGASKPPAGYNLFSIGGEPGDWKLKWDRYGLFDAAVTLRHEHHQILLG
ncbi:hypothetical protein D3C72_2483470 [compost metagenome]